MTGENSKDSNDPLAEEIETFEENRLEMVKEHDGEFVLIRGKTIVDFRLTYEDAIALGYKKFGVYTPYLVKQVRTVDPVYYFPPRPVTDAHCVTTCLPGSSGSVDIRCFPPRRAPRRDSCRLYISKPQRGL